MRKTQVMTMILTPQAVKFMLPAIISQCVVALKDTSLGFAGRLRHRSSCPAASSDRDQFAGSYLMSSCCRGNLHRHQLLLSALAYWLERRLATRGRGAEQAVAQVEGVLDAG